MPKNGRKCFSKLVLKHYVEREKKTINKDEIMIGNIKLPLLTEL